MSLASKDAPRVILSGLPDEALRAQLATVGVHLRGAEVRTLCAALGRDPTVAELALVNSLWSEHCSYKSSRALLRLLPTSAPNVVLGPGADAGIVRLPRVDAHGRASLTDAGPRAGAGARCIAMGHESHNHPSQLLPFEGAATGIGGIVRDVYCMGADVIGVLDALRFGDPRGAQADTVRQIARGVVHGIWEYGNALGVPNLGGDVEFDGAFDDNCLVNVVAVGLLDEDELIPSVVPSDARSAPYVLLLVGKPTDDSGLGGAAFASGVLDTDEHTQQRGAVQLPDPFFKRVLTEANKAAIALLRRHGASFGVKDLGAAGLGGATSEMAAGGELGLELDLDTLHRVRADETAAVLLVAETQERYALAVPEALVGALVQIYEQEFELGAMVRGAGARAIGRFTAAPRFRVRYGGILHVDMPLALVTDAPRIEWPRGRRAAVPVAPPVDRTRLAQRDVAADLETVLASVEGGSRHWLFQHYDSDVQGRTMLRPGDGDAGVLFLRRDEPLGIAVAVGGSSRAGERDAWRAGAAAVCEAVRNVVAVGATPWALTDCLNYGSPENPATMQDLADGVDGLAAAARTLGLRGYTGAPLPFISGNVSLYNESLARRPIPPTPIVACLGVYEDVARARGLSLKTAGDRLYLLSGGAAALGASLYARVTGQAACGAAEPLPEIDLDGERQRFLAVLAAFDAGTIEACHDVGEGGLALALVEMILGRSGQARLGIECELGADAAPLVVRLFSEGGGYVCAVRPENARAFETACAPHEVQPVRIGAVVAEPRFVVRSEGRTVIDLDARTLASRWRHGLAAVFDEGSET
jgi:phosphoribosylformylglycinamidine synthase subunit PurL